MAPTNLSNVDVFGENIFCGSPGLDFRRGWSIWESLGLPFGINMVSANEVQKKVEKDGLTKRG